MGSDRGLERALKSPWVLKEATILAWRAALDPQFKLFPALFAGVDRARMQEQKFAPLVLDRIQSVAGKQAGAIVAEVAAALRRPEDDDTPLDRLAGVIADLLERSGTNTLRAMARKLGVGDVAWDPARSHLERGLLINRTANTVIRLLPAYIVTEKEIDEALSLLDAAIIAAAL